MTSYRVKLLSVACAVLFCLPSQTSLADQPPAICDNTELFKAVSIIHSACHKLKGCNFQTLSELDSRVDRATLLAALRSPYLFPVHIFFPEGKWERKDILDWNTIKREQLESIKKGAPNLKNSIVFVIGRASYTGNIEKNREISRKRMETVMDYLENELQIPCKDYKGGWLGKEYMQLSESNARDLNLAPDDYRQDSRKILNQAVHVFIFPCADRLPD